MHTIDASNPYGTLDEGRLVQFEHELGCVLPSDYRAFLLEHNGGVPQPTAVILPNTTEPCGHLCEMYLLTPDSGSLEIAWWNLADHLPKELLAIASLDVAGLICIGIAGEHDGRIYYVAAADETKRLPWSNIVLLADSFATFCAGLGEPQPGSATG